jgi:hypothetical protein
VKGSEYKQSTLYKYENTIMKPTKNCYKEEREGQGVKKEEYRRSKLDQNRLYACM